MSSTLQQIIDNVSIESTVLDQEKLQDLIAKRPENTAQFARIYNIKKVVKGNPKRPYRW